MMNQPSSPTPEDFAALRELASALTAVERGEERQRVTSRVPGSVVGLVGPPGVGKSSLLSGLVARCRARGERVVVLAVDPTSPVTGGALLGDRIRLAQHATDPGVFVRSFASRGHPGGLAAAVPDAVQATLALGWDRVFVEPVGGGQNDIDVAACADTVVLVVSPESGDDVQALKAGILEMADLVVVNKADRPGSSAFRSMLRSQWRGHNKGPIILVSALDGTGIDELDEATRAPMTTEVGRHDAALVSAVLNDATVALRRRLSDPVVRTKVVDLAREGRRRDAIRMLLEEGERA